MNFFLGVIVGAIVSSISRVIIAVILESDEDDKDDKQFGVEIKEN